MADRRKFIEMLAAGGQRSAYGYPVQTPEETGLEEYFKANPNVAGMAWGGGMNASDPSSKRSVVVNPYNQYMGNPQAREGLIINEAVRHRMDETKYTPASPLSPQQTEYAKSLGPYNANREAFRRSIIARLMGGEAVPGVTARQQVEADQFWTRMPKR